MKKLVNNLDILAHYLVKFIHCTFVSKLAHSADSDTWWWYGNTYYFWYSNNNHDDHKRRWSFEAVHSNPTKNRLRSYHFTPLQIIFPLKSQLKITTSSIKNPKRFITLFSCCHLSQIATNWNTKHIYNIFIHFSNCNTKLKKDLKNKLPKID